MMKHTAMIQLIGEVCIEEFVAGQKTDVESIKSARALRTRLFDAVRELYQDLEFETCERERYEVDLKKAKDKIEELVKDNDNLVEDFERVLDERDKLRNDVRSQQETIRKLTLTDPDNPDSPLWSDFTPGPDDMEPELRDCLPFPDVDDIAPASELLGGDE